LRGDGFDGLIFIEVGPVMFEIAGDGGEGKIGTAEKRGEGAPLFAKSISCMRAERRRRWASTSASRTSDSSAWPVFESWRCGVSEVLLNFGEVAADVEKLLGARTRRNAVLTEVSTRIFCS